MRILSRFALEQYVQYEQSLDRVQEIDRYPEWNITRSFECENRISPLINESSLESSLTLFDAQKFRAPSRRTLKKIENDARDNVSPSAEQRKDLNNQDRLAMKKNRYYAYGFSS